MKLCYFVERLADGSFARFEQSIDSDGHGGDWFETTQSFSQSDLADQADRGEAVELPIAGCTPFRGKIVGTGWVFQEGGAA